MPHEHEQHARHPQPSPAREHARHEENAGREPPSARSETRAEEFVNAHDIVPVVSRDEHRAHDHARQQVADDELDVRIVPQGITFPRCPEKCPRANLRREDRSQHRPPRNLPVTQRESFHAPALTPLAQPDADDDGKVGEDNECIDGDSIHARDFTGGSSACRENRQRQQISAFDVRYWKFPVRPASSRA